MFCQFNFCIIAVLGVVVVVVVVVMSLPTYGFFTGCMQEVREGTSHLLSFLHPFARI